jgi:hypothetical protein
LKEGKIEEIAVQRQSSDVSGKAQKYSRVEPREFVQFIVLPHSAEAKYPLPTAMHIGLWQR